MTEQPKAKYTLVYWKGVTGGCQPNRAITNEGDEVEYTGMINEVEYGPWNAFYKAPDAIVVGYIASTSQITYISPMAMERWPLNYYQ